MENENKTTNIEMNILWAVKQLQAGERVRQVGWEKERYFYKKGFLFNNYHEHTAFSCGDIEAEWELFKQ